MFYAGMNLPIPVISVLALVTLGATLIHAVFAGFVFLKNPTGSVNRIWSLTILCLVVWGAGEFVLQITPDLRTAIIVNSLTGVGFTMLPSIFLHFSFEFSGDSIRRKPWKYLLVYFPGVLFSAAQVLGFITTPALLKWGYAADPSYGYIVYICWLELYFAWALYLCYKKLSSTGEKKERYQAMLVMIGVTIPLLVSSVTDALLPLLGIQTFRIAIIGTTITDAFVTYAVVKYQLMSLTPATTAGFILDALLDFLVVTDTAGNILFTNRSFRREMLDDGGSSAMHLRDISARGDEIMEAAAQAAKENHGQLIECKCRRRDGKVFDALTSISAIRDKGELVGFVLLISDVTEKKKLESALLRSQRLDSLGTLAGGIAHDLNNILSPIILSIETLKMDISEENRLKIAGIMESSARRGATLVKRILAFSRGSQGDMKDIRLNDLLTSTLGIVKETFPRSISIRVNLPEKSAVVRGDETQLSQVLLNLMVNARDAMPGGGTLVISSESLLVDEVFARVNPDAKTGPHAVVTVSDTGTGIPPELIDRIFDPFFTTKEVGKGTGIGLSTVATILKTHSGFLKVYSEPGKGSTFSVYLPLADGTGTVTVVRSESPRGNGEYILVVEDELSVRTITKFVLESNGYRTFIAGDGLEGLEVYREYRDLISVVLLDGSMPRMNGREAAGEIKKIDPAARIILQSGLPTADGQDRGIDVAAFLPKPFTEQQLLQTLVSVLQSPEQKQDSPA